MVGASVTAVAQGLKFVLQFGTQVVLARMLDPAQFGLVAMVAPVLGLVITLNDFGLGQAIVQRTDITHRQVSSLFWINLAIGLGLTLLAMGAAPLIALAYGEPRTLWITVAAATLILLSSAAVVPLGLLNRQMRFVSLSVTEVASMLAGLASGLLAAWCGAGYWSLVIMQAVNSAFALTLAWCFCGWRPGRPAIAPGVGAMMRFGAHLMGSNLGVFLSSSADHLIVGAVSGKVALGLYDRSQSTVVKPLMQLMAPAARVAVPLLSRLQDRPAQYRRAYLLMLQLTTAACVPGLIATLLVAEPLVALLFGPKWMGMVPVFWWIGFGGIASALSASTWWLFVTQNRSAEQLRGSVAAALVGVAAFGIGSLWGVVGVAMVSALAYTGVQTPLLVWMATRRGPVRAADVRDGLLPLAVAACACAVASWGLTRQLTHWPAFWLIAAAFAAAYGSFLLMLLAQPAGRRLLAGARALLYTRAVTA